MFFESRHVLTCSDSDDCEASSCQGTDILLADAASLLVVNICFTIFSFLPHRTAATSQHRLNFSASLYYQNNSRGWQQVRGL